VRRGNQGTVTVWGTVAELVPHAFVATTLSAYAPGPTVPLIVRVVVAKLPTYAPVTFST
jgi:hypothetical protein